MTTAQSGHIAQLIKSHIKDIGELKVRRSLPAASRQRVGPFIFFDHMGPVDFPPGSGVSVRPHPHIGLATITYLFAGEIVHRDSLGYVQAITANAVNWMTAGKGITHSERSSPDLMASGSHLHGIQAWVALPIEAEECEPRFEHYAAADIPLVESGGVRARIIAGSAFGEKSPVNTASETMYAEIDLDKNASVQLPHDIDECAVYVVAGDVNLDGQIIPSHSMAVLNQNARTMVTATTESKIMLLGGATLPGERTIWWNFVSSSKDRLAQAKQDWRDGRFTAVPGETEFIPLPKD